MHSSVTPYVGVWIETYPQGPRTVRETVTPYVGVWIETHVCAGVSAKEFVTPYVGVWIETLAKAQQDPTLKSLLMWECGLKPDTSKVKRVEAESLLMWECGLKHHIRDNERR